jgi:hypothetical protein
VRPELESCTLVLLRRGERSGEYSEDQAQAIQQVGLEEARALAEQDPAVGAGRLAVEVLTWYFPRGEVEFRRTTRTRT